MGDMGERGYMCTGLLQLEGINWAQTSLPHLPSSREFVPLRTIVISQNVVLELSLQLYKLTLLRVETHDQAIMPTQLANKDELASLALIIITDGLTYIEIY